MPHAGPLLALLAAVPWPTGAGDRPLSERLVPPPGFTRVQAAPDAFGTWLRRLPVLPDKPPVHLFDGTLKQNQSAHLLVLDVDVGRRDLQQCADAVIRLFAEWQRAAGRANRICFRFTSGDALPWSRWAAGDRPRIAGRKVTLARQAKPSRSYRTFRRYLDLVFSYAGTASLIRDLVRPNDRIAPGDVFIQGGSPGHAVLVVDVVENDRGERRFALAQSYMPAQQIHVLRRPGSESPWFTEAEGVLKTPEWTFDASDRRRFFDSGCR